MAWGVLRELGTGQKVQEAARGQHDGNVIQLVWGLPRSSGLNQPAHKPKATVKPPQQPQHAQHGLGMCSTSSACPACTAQHSTAQHCSPTVWMPSTVTGYVMESNDTESTLEAPSGPMGSRAEM